MITPRFSVEQNHSHLIVYIEAPYVKFNDGEMVIQDQEFSFYCKPYYLKLHFSGEVVEDGTEAAFYCVEKRQFEIKIPKANKGEVFENLDMLTLLMTSSTSCNKVKGSHLIEVLESSRSNSIEEDADFSTDKPNNDNLSTTGSGIDTDSDKEIDWAIEQKLPLPGDEPVSLMLSMPKYGFNHQVSGLFTKRVEECHELLDILDPDTTPATDRPSLQFKDEQRKFSCDHYIKDLIDDDEILTAVNSELDIASYLTSSSNRSNAIQFSEKEVDHLVNFPKKEHLLDREEKIYALLGLVDIIFAYLYEMRTTNFEMNVESAWTIRKLSSTLSWLTTAAALKTTLINCVRRSLCFPLYRHWVLAMKVLEDLEQVFRMGKKAVLKCLLHIYEIFCSVESYHILNDLYIVDYCVWIQALDEYELISLANFMNQLKLTKEEVNLDLNVVEEDLLESSSSSDSTADSDDSETSSGLSNSKRNDGNTASACEEEKDIPLDICENLESLRVSDCNENVSSSRRLVEVIDP